MKGIPSCCALPQGLRRIPTHNAKKVSQALQKFTDSVQVAFPQTDIKWSIQSDGFTWGDLYLVVKKKKKTHIPIHFTTIVSIMFCFVSVATTCGISLPPPGTELGHGPWCRSYPLDQPGNSHFYCFLYTSIFLDLLYQVGFNSYLFLHLKSLIFLCDGS